MIEILPKIEGGLSSVEIKSIQLIQEEIEKIESPDIREFTYQAFGEVNRKFWSAPSSSTNRHHPAEDNGEGGLVRHTVKAAAVLEEVMREMGASKKECDIGRSAILLHDTCKNGLNWENEGTDVRHGSLASVWLAKFHLPNEEVKSEILNAVRYHMGQWSFVVSPYEERTYSKDDMMDNITEVARALHPSRIERAVQIADYYASRQSMSFFPGVTTNYPHA